jgi:hypothetical protein
MVIKVTFTTCPAWGGSTVILGSLQRPPSSKESSRASTQRFAVQNNYYSVLWPATGATSPPAKRWTLHPHNQPSRVVLATLIATVCGGRRKPATSIPSRRGLPSFAPLPLPRRRRPCLKQPLFASAPRSAPCHDRTSLDRPPCA